VKRHIEPETWIEIIATEFDVDYIQFTAHKNNTEEDRETNYSTKQ